MNIFKYISLATAFMAIPCMLSSCSDKEDIIEFPADINIYDGAPRVKATNLTLRSSGATTWDWNSNVPADNLDYFGVAYTNEEDALDNGFEYIWGGNTVGCDWTVDITCSRYPVWSDEKGTNDVQFQWTEPYYQLFLVLDNELEFSFISDETISETTLTFPDGSEKTITKSNPLCKWTFASEAYYNNEYNTGYNFDEYYFTIKVISKGTKGNKNYVKTGEIQLKLDNRYIVKDGIWYPV